jgi:predicted NBD/HSP70 family sugar kinase
MPSLDLLRSLSDEHVLNALIDHPRLTRTELADLTGISKPTVSESVRRLVAAGIVLDTGERTSGRGRSGAYFALASSLPGALVVNIAPDAVTTESVDVQGHVQSRSVRALPGTTQPATVRRALKAAASEVLSGQAVAPALAVVSAADPVDRATGRLVHLPDSPFLIGEFDPVRELGGFVAGEVVVDNDVNWAARAEAAHGGALDERGDFAYLHLGSGLGCAVVADGVVLRGRGGLAGEVAHVITCDHRGRAVTFTGFFEAAGLRRVATPAVDVGALIARVEAGGRSAAAFRSSLGDAVAGVLTAVIALADPGLVVVGGDWGKHPEVLDAIRDGLSRAPRGVDVRAPLCVDEPALAGAREHAVQRLRTQLLQSVR